MTQRSQFQGIGLLVTVVFSAVLLWALATVVWPVPVVYAQDPNAVDDSFTVDEDSVDNSLYVLANDTGDELTVAVVGTPAQGGTAINGGDVITYTPAADFFGTEVFAYTVRDIGFLTATATVNVTPVNDPPVANDDVYSVAEGDILTVAAPAGVLTNDTDVDAGDILTATLVSSPSHGTLTLHPDGSFSYTHDGSDTTSDSFTYRAYDGTDYSNVATVTITIELTDPVITTITVTSDDSTYFHNPGLEDSGGEVFFNSLADQGGGQTITVTISFIDDSPYSLEGDTAFGDSPAPDTSGPPWTVSYSIEDNAPSQTNRVFTVTDEAGNTDTAAITFTQDNVAPIVVLTNVTDPGYDYDLDWGETPDELDTDGSNWYTASDFPSTNWTFTSYTNDNGAGLASGTAVWDHSNDITRILVCGFDGDGTFYDVSGDNDGTVSVTVAIADNVGNLASDLVVFNIDKTEPIITSPYINKFEDAIHLHVVDDTIVYYGDDMTGPEVFRVQGNAQDIGGVGLHYVAYSEALGESYAEDDSNLASWSRDYTADQDNTTSGWITASIYDRLGNVATQVFTYTRDIGNPTSVADSSQYDNGNPIVVTYTNATDTGGSGLQWVRLWYKKDSGTWADSGLPAETGPSGSFNFTPTGDGTYYFATRAEDNVGNLQTMPTGSGDDETIYDTKGPDLPEPVNFAYPYDSDSGGDGIDPLPGYYDDTVIDLEWDPFTDDGSGLLTPPYHLGTAPQPAGDLYDEDSPYTVSSSGTYSIYLTAEDNAGNISEDAVTGPVVVDTQAPQGSVSCPESTTQKSFTVDWSVTDQGPAGLISKPYYVGYNVDGGDWQDWIIATSAVTAIFGPDSPITVEYSHTYCFLMRAVDKAGNVYTTNGNDCTETIDPNIEIEKVFLPIIIVPAPNWGFETGDFTSWQHGGQLAQSVSTAMPHSGSYSALLGNPGYNCYNVPVGSAWLHRSVRVPSSGSPTLSFWYRIRTQDKNSTLSDKYDLFAVYINGSDLVVKDANITYPFGCGTTRDLEWKYVSFPLDAYRGQTIQITFYNYNRAPSANYPERYNTYTFIDDVSVQ